MDLMMPGPMPHVMPLPVQQRMGPGTDTTVWIVVGLIGESATEDDGLSLVIGSWDVHTIHL